MKAVLRTLAAVVAGLLVSFVLVMGVEYFSSVVHPFPEGFGGTTEEVCRHVERYPQWVLAVAVSMWALTAFVGTWIAKRIGNIYSFAIVALLLFAAVVFNISMLPYPIWFKTANLLAIPAVILIAGRLSTRHKAVRTGDGS